MAALWDPRTLLEVDPRSLTPCVGTTLKNTRCTHSFQFFLKADLNEASHLLDEISLCQPASSRAKLSLLAEYTLCPRNHRKNLKINQVARDWWTAICASYPNGIVPVAPVVPATTYSRTLRYGSEEDGRRTTRRSTSRTALPNVAIPTPPQSPSPAPRDLPVDESTLITASFTLRATMTSAAVSPTRPMTPPVSSISRRTRGLFVPSASPSQRQSPFLPRNPVEAESEEEFEEESEEESDEDSEDVETHEEVTHEEDAHEEETPEEEVDDRITIAASTSSEASSLQTPPATPRRSHSPTATTWVPLTPEPNKTTPCPHSSRRKPIVDDCPICNEPMHCLDDAVWCRAQCGQNMHRGCFAPWRTDCLDREAPVTCVYCRAQWKYEWED